MPIDPNIPLQFHPDVAAVNPLDQQAKATQIAAARQNMQQSAAASAQALQGGAQDIQLKQIQMDQNAAVNKAYSDAFSIDPATGKGSIDQDKMISALATAGHGSAVAPQMEAITKAQTAVATLAKTRGEVNDQQNDAAGAIGAAVTAANNDPHLFLNLLQHGIDTKAVDAGAVQPIIQHIQQLLAADPSGASAAPEVQAAAQHLMAQSPKQTQLNTAEEAAAARKKTADTGAGSAALKQPAEQAAADQAVLVGAAQKLHAATDGASYAQVLGSLPPKVAVQFPPAFDPQTTSALIDRAAMTPEQRTQADQAKANADREAARNAEQTKNEQELRRQGGQRNSIEQDRLNMEKQQFGFTPGGGVSVAAQGIAKGDFDPQTVRAMLRKNPGLIAQIKTVDPNFDEANIDNRYQTLKEFTSTSIGKAGGQALALNTLIHHADLYMQTAEALKNQSFVPGNAIYNAVASTFGAAPPTNAALVARFFAGETGKVATGGVPAEGEINGILKSLGTSSSPEGIAGAGKTLLQIAGGRMAPLLDRAKQAKIDNVVQILGPDSKEILQRRGFDPNTMKPGAPGATGGLGRGVPDEVKSLLGAAYVKPGVHTLSDGSKWMKAADGTITAQ